MTSANERLRQRLKTVEDGEEMPGAGTGGDGRRSLRVVDIGRPIIINALSGPIEYLVSRGELETDLDPEGMGRARYHTVLRMRDLFEGAGVGGLRSPSWESAGGGRSESAGAIHAYKLDCIRSLNAIQDSMPKDWLFAMLQGVVWEDTWLDLGPLPEVSQAVSAESDAKAMKAAKAKAKARKEALRQRRRRTIDSLHFAIDKASLVLKALELEDFKRRWGNAYPRLDAAARRRIRESREKARRERPTLPGAPSA